MKPDPLTPESGARAPLRVLFLGKCAVGDAFAVLEALSRMATCLGPLSLMVVEQDASRWVFAQWPFFSQGAVSPVRWRFWRLPQVAWRVRRFAPHLVWVGNANKRWQHILAAVCGAPLQLCQNTLTQQGQGQVRARDFDELLRVLAHRLGHSPGQFPPQKEMLAWRGLNPAHLPSREGVALAPFASAGWPSKQWPLAHYEALARELVKRGVPVFWLCAAAEAPRLGHLLQLPGTSWPGQGSAQGLAHTLARSVVSVSGESAIAHAAPLFGATPVVLLGPTAEKFVSRFPGRPAPVVLKHATLDCLGCHQRQCPLPPPRHHACLQQLPPEEVLRTVTTALARPTPTLVPEQDFGPDGVWANNFA